MLTKTEGRINCGACGMENWAAAPLCVNCSQALVAIAPSVDFRNKTATQKVARLFEVVDYVLILPGTLAFLYGMLAVLSFAGGGNSANGLFAAGGFLLAYLTGCYLFLGFFRHSRGRQIWGGPVALWGLTALFNLPPFLACAYAFRDSTFANPGLGLLSVWYGLVVVLSLWSLRKTLVEGAAA